MKQLPTLKQLEYLVSLDEERHFGHAADACNVTPSTVSAGIRDLEIMLGVTLAERTKRSVLMTPLGREIAKRGRQILQDAEEITALANAAEKAPLSGDIHLGVIPTVGPFLLPTVLPKLWQKYPHLRLYLYEEQTEDLLAKLRGGELDAALIGLPYDVGELQTKILFEDSFQFACSTTHRLASKENISTADLDGATILLLQEGHCLREHALKACALEYQSEFAATSLHTLVQMVSADMGVTLLPQLGIEAGIDRLAPITLIPLAQPASRSIGLVWRPSTIRKDELEILGREIVP